MADATNVAKLKELADRHQQLRADEERISRAGTELEKVRRDLSDRAYRTAEQIRDLLAHNQTFVHKGLCYTRSGQLINTTKLKGDQD